MFTTLAAVLAFGMSTAQAVPLHEIGDAGQLTSTAQAVGGGITSILGALDALPEPGSLALLAAVLAMLGVTARTRKKA